MKLACIFFLVVLLILLWYLFMQAFSLYGTFSQAFMLQIGMNRHGHWLNYGKKKFFFENSFSPWKRSKVGSIARSSLGGEMDVCFAASPGVTLSAVGMSELQVLLQCKSQPQLGSRASPAVLRAQPGHARRGALLDPAL